jgi:hypothetical protein
MAIIKKNEGNEFKEFPFDQYGLDNDGNYKLQSSYQGEQITLSPDGYNNEPKLMYSCHTTVASLLEEGKTAIYTDDAETHRTLWKTVRDGIITSELNDILYLGYERDHALTNLGDDFIEIANHGITVDGDLDMNSPEGGIDVFMVRCGNAYIAGNGNSDHYFINFSEKCKKEGFTNNVYINEISFGNDNNKLHLCDLSFHNMTGNTLDTLSNNGIKLGISSYDFGLELYLSNTVYHSNEPNIIISHFCDNYNKIASNPPIAAIVDKNGIEISLKGLGCKDIEQYIATNNFSTIEEINACSSSSPNYTNENTIIKYIPYVTLLSNIGELISSFSEYFGFTHNEL